MADITAASARELRGRRTPLSGIRGAIGDVLGYVFAAPPVYPKGVGPKPGSKDATATNVERIAIRARAHRTTASVTRYPGQLSISDDADIRTTISRLTRFPHPRRT